MSDAGTLGGSGVAPAAFADLGPGGAPGMPADLDLISDIAMSLTVELGRVKLTVRDLLALREGSLIELDRVAGSPVDVMVNGSLVAHGDVVVVDDELGVRITEIVKRP